MRRVLAFALLLCLAAASAPAQQQGPREEIEYYFVAPFTLNKFTWITMADGRRLSGTVVSGDDDKIVLDDRGNRTELQTNQITRFELKRDGGNKAAVFAGSLIGGVGLGFAGAYIGKKAGENIRDDATPGRAAPMIGGLGFGLLGSWLGGRIARSASSQHTVYIVERGVEGQAPKTGALASPSPDASSSASSQRVQPYNPRR